MSLSGEVRKTAEATLKRSSPKRRGYLVSDSPDEELPRAAELAAPAPESVKPKRKRRRSIISRSQDNLAQHEEAECHSDAEESDRARKGTGDSGFAKRKKKRPAFDAGQVTNATLESSADRRESPSSGGSEHPTVKEETGANSVDQASPQQPAGPARQLTLLTWMKSPLANGTKVAAPPRRTRRANAVSSRGSLSRSGGKTKRQSTLAAGGGTLTCTGTEKEKTKNPASRAAVDSGARKEQEKRTKKSRRRPVAVKGEAQSARAKLTNRSRQSRGRNKEDGRKKKKCHEKTPMELKLLGEKRLTNFRCADAARYPVGDEWIMEIEGERGSFLNVNKILDPTSPDNYTEFVQSVLSLRDEGQALPNDERLTSQQILDLQKAVKRQPDPNKKTLDVKIDGTEYRFTDDVGRLAGESAELTPLAAEVKRRVVFTPSKGRSNAALLSWNGDASPRSTMQQVLLVPRSEHDAYAGLWAGQWLVVSTENDTIGAARHHIIKLARFWKLDDLWMIDDSVPTTQFYRTSLMDPPRQLLGSSPGSLPSVNPTPESARVAFSTVLDEIEGFAASYKQRKPAIVGLATTRSAQAAVEKKATVGKFSNKDLTRIEPQINKRAPTSCVYVTLKQIPRQLQYDVNLPSKEDIILAARLVAAGKSIVMYRGFHFKDVWMSEGGCARSQARPALPGDMHIHRIGTFNRSC